MKTTLVASLFVSVIVCLPARAGTAIWVVQCNGDWEERTIPERPAKLPCNGARGALWLPLTKESKLALASRKPKQWIIVRIARTGERHRFDCDTVGQCDPPPLQFAQFVPKEDSVGLLDAFLQSPGKAYARVRLMLSKGDNDQSGRVTADHVVIAEGQRILIRDLLSPKAPAGEYSLEICPFDELNGCPQGGKPTSVR